MVIGLLFIAAGIFCFMGAYKQWGFYTRDRKYQRMVRWFGEGAARAFYMGLGVFVIIVAIIYMLCFVRLYTG